MQDAAYFLYQIKEQPLLASALRRRRENRIHKFKPSPESPPGLTERKYSDSKPNYKPNKKKKNNERGKRK
jgi:hypothetical protein